MKKLIILLITAVSASQAVILRNGEEADRTRSNEIYTALKSIDPVEQKRLYYLIWSITQTCRTEKAENCNLRELAQRASPLEGIPINDTIQKLTDMKIITNEHMDRETQTIIDSSLTLEVNSLKIRDSYLRSFTLVNPIDERSTARSEAVNRHVRSHQEKLKNKISETKPQN